MNGQFTRKDIAVIICSRRILRREGLPRDANVRDVCREAGVSRKTGYQWASQLERQPFITVSSRRPKRAKSSPKERKREKGRKWAVESIPDDDRRILEEWRRSDNRTKWAKAVVILGSASVGLEQLSSKTECPIPRMKRWIAAYKTEGVKGIEKKGRRPLPQREVTDTKQRRLIEILHGRPTSYGINRSNWTQESLATAYERTYREKMSRSDVGRLFRKARYRWKKSRRVLASPDRYYREKVELVLETLQSLKDDEVFLFVDELGPLRVKKYGGRCYTPKGRTPTHPQNSRSRGSITLYGALSATTNQMTWFYGNSKDSAAMIDLAELLYNQHYDKSRIYITWDAASWHRSNELLEWLDALNARNSEAGMGPGLELVPLPSNAQFLDVIEAVFSGMKRAVVHNSDYQSEEEMKEAISRHFRERNEFFRQNPKRAGKKIWEIDFFDDHSNIRSGDYREW